MDAEVRILVPVQASEGDYFLARSLANEIGDRFDVHPRIKPASSADSAVRSIVMGSLENPLVQQYCAQMGMTETGSPVRRDTFYRPTKTWSWSPAETIAGRSGECSPYGSSC